MSTTMAQIKTKTRPKTVSFTLHANPLPAAPTKPHTLHPQPPRVTLLYHLHSIYLFMASDLKTLLLPNIIFGVLGSLSSAIAPSSTSIAATTIPLRALRIALWFALNLLPFAIANQRLPHAIREDTINKPWRPLPARRLTPAQAHELMITAYVVAGAASAILGGLRSCLALIVLAYCYNCLGGADVSGTVRNIMNVSFYLCAMVGTIEVAAGGDVLLSGRAWAWFALIGAVVLTTVHVQDLPDQEGDAARGRRTIPLEIGDERARWSVAVLDLVWSVAAPIFWHKSAMGFILPVGLAGTVAVRLLRKRSVREDKATLIVWNLWMVSLYLLPLGQ